ncbi:MAG: flagellar assembly protein FliW, partial [Lachnospiraceae bacterium]|nr:flagellar assembly protein FliW [Lachnospiraceae bacterium]
MNPELVMPGYEPKFPQELLAPLGELDEEDTLVLVTVTVPKDIKKTTVNLRAPIIINAGTCKAVQLIADDENYSIKYAIYDSLMATQHA